MLKKIGAFVITGIIGVCISMAVLHGIARYSAHVIEKKVTEMAVTDLESSGIEVVSYEAGKYIIGRCEDDYMVMNLETGRNEIVSIEELLVLMGGEA